MRSAIDLDQYDGLGLADLVRKKEITAAELLEAVIARAEERNPGLNAIVGRLYDQARAAVAAGVPEGPFTGVPYLLKDLGVLYTGAETSFGSTFFTGFVADHDSELTARLKRGGLVIFGKTNTPELGLAPSTEPRRFGPTRNPWNAAYSAGGSSGGAAAAVAGGILPMAHATDGGGSIRVLRSLRHEADARAQPHGSRRGRRLGRCIGRARGDANGARQRCAPRRRPDRSWPRSVATRAGSASR